MIGESKAVGYVIDIHKRRHMVFAVFYTVGELEQSPISNVYAPTLWPGGFSSIQDLCDKLNVERLGELPSAPSLVK